MNSVSNQSLDLSIIIVNYNGAAFIATCLDAIFNHKSKYSYEVIIVDNYSQDESLAILDKYKSKIKLIVNEVNLGFGKANNQGLKIAQGKFIFYLNSDAFLLENTIDKLIDFFKNTKDAGLVAPQLLNQDGTTQFNGSIFSKFIFNTEKPKAIGFVAAAAILSSKKLLDKIGGFDENFFFYNEDIDLCKSILKLGHKIYYVPEIKVIHVGGASTKSIREDAVVEGFRGGLYLCKKHYGNVIYQIYRGFLGFYLLVSIVILSLMGFVMNKYLILRNAYCRILVLLIKDKVTRDI
ncbi:MAG: glycosyltransferase family 2 protein [Candidatus Margulisiibacteriota bacterium]|jgi:hypothetical protein